MEERPLSNAVVRLLEPFIKWLFLIFRPQVDLHVMDDHVKI